MIPRVLIDTGPLVAFLNRRDQYHAWAKEQMARLEPPLLTCESVLSEVCFLVRNLRGGSEAIIKLVQRGLVTVAFDFQAETTPVGKLLARYANVPISLADACLVRMAELYEGSVILTLDGDFRVYRKHGRYVIPVVMPDHV
jgi:predicted nucleic acid-binding protein